MQPLSSNHQRASAPPIGGQFDTSTAALQFLSQQNPHMMIPTPLLGSASQTQPFMLPQQLYRASVPFPLSALQFPSIGNAASLNPQPQFFLGLGGQILVNPQAAGQLQASVALNPAANFIHRPAQLQFPPPAPTGVSHNQVRPRQPIPENEQQKIRDSLQRGPTLPKQASTSAASEALVHGDAGVVEEAQSADVSISAPNGNVGTVADPSRLDAIPPPSTLHPIPAHLRPQLAQQVDMLNTGKPTIGLQLTGGTNVRAPLFVPPANPGIQLVPIGQSSAPSAQPPKERHRTAIQIVNPNTGQSLDMNLIRKETEEKKRTAVTTSTGHEEEPSKFTGVIEMKPDPNQVTSFTSSPALASVPSESSPAQQVPSSESSSSDASDPTIGTIESTVSTVAFNPAVVKSDIDTSVAAPHSFKFGDFPSDSASPTPPPDALSRSDKSPDEVTIGTIGPIQLEEGASPAEAEKPTPSEPVERQVYTSGELRDLFSLRLNFQEMNPSISVLPEITQQKAADFKQQSDFFTFTPNFYPTRSLQPGAPPPRMPPQRSSALRVFQPPSQALDAKALHHDDKAWKPELFKSQSMPAERGSDLKQMKKKLLGILNRITPEKFRVLLEQIFSLIRDSLDMERLRTAIDVIFDKAVVEPHFAISYAYLCKNLFELPDTIATVTEPPPAQADQASSEQTVSKPQEQTMGAICRKMLITRCQMEFEKKGIPILESIAKKEAEIEALRAAMKATGETAEGSDQQKSKQSSELRSLQEDVEELQVKAKKRALGTVKFIGELFKLKMLSESIMFHCITNLLREPEDEEGIECLTKLLVTVGKDLDNSKSESKSERMTQVINNLKKMISSKQTSLRLRCLLQDVVDLHDAQWVPRHEENAPKTIDQVRREAEEEERERRLYEDLKMQPPLPPPLPPRRSEILVPDVTLQTALSFPPNERGPLTLPARHSGQRPDMRDEARERPTRDSGMRAPPLPDPTIAITAPKYPAAVYADSSADSRGSNASSQQMRPNISMPNFSRIKQATTAEGEDSLLGGNRLGGRWQYGSNASKPS